MGRHSSRITDLDWSRIRDWSEELYGHQPRLYQIFLYWALDIDHLLQEGFLKTSGSKLRWLNEVQVSICEWYDARKTRSERNVLLYESLMDHLRANPPEEPARPSYAVLVSAVVLLALVNLKRNGDRGGSKAYSRGSLDFRDIYVAIVLFRGAYVWIKFREVASKGVYSRKLTDQVGRITRVVYEPRFKPPRENGRVFRRIYLGQYASPEEASILYRIAAFYNNENQGSLLDLEDGRCFSIPPMNERERSLTGLEKRAWVKVQVMKVHEEFKEKAAAALLQELIKAWEDEVPQEQDEGFAVSNGHSLGSHEGPAIPASQFTPNTESGMGISSSNQLYLFQTLARTQQELITYQQQQISLLQQQLQDYRAQISEIKYQHCLHQLMQDINEGVPSNEVEMEQSMHLQNHPGLTTLPYAGAEAQEAFI